jgi:hypothetical protein
MRAQQVIGAVIDNITADLSRGDASRIRFFLTGETKGGWEGWLQVEAAVAVDAVITKNSSADRYVMLREVAYAAAKRCDLVFAPGGSPLAPAGKPAAAGAAPKAAVGGGSTIWIELKTQRADGYDKTLDDFIDDINKLKTFTDSNDKEAVCVAFAILVGDAKAAKFIKMPPIPSGTSVAGFHYIKGTGQHQILNAQNVDPAKITAADFVCLAWKNSQP